MLKVLFLSLFVALPLRAGAEVEFIGSIKHWVDGDTVDVDFHGLELRLRLRGMDTPERGQPWWKSARKKLRSLTEGEQLKFVIVGWERDSRTGNPKRGSRHEVEIFLLDGRNVNDLLVQYGLARAWCDEPWLSLRNRFQKLQSQAQEEKMGIWGDSNFDFSCNPIKSIEFISEN